jgi:hypothetical protein
VFEPYIGHLADEIGNQSAHHCRGECGPLLERAKEVEGQGLAGQQISPEALDVDDGADLAIGDLVLDQRDQREVEQVDAGAADAIADAAAKAARATVGIEVAAAGEAVLLAPKALAEAGDGAEPRVSGLGAAVSAQQVGRQQRQGV